MDLNFARFFVQFLGGSSVRLVLNEGYSVAKAAERLGISPNNLYKWKEQYEEGRLVLGMKQAQPTPQEAELRHLREENRQLKLEAEILKKASAYFAKQLK